MHRLRLRKEAEEESKERIARFDSDHRRSLPSSSSSSLLNSIIRSGGLVSSGAGSGADSKPPVGSGQRRRSSVFKAAVEKNLGGEEEEEDEDKEEWRWGWGRKGGDGDVSEEKEAAAERGGALSTAKRARRRSGAVGKKERKAGPLEQFRLLMARSWRQVNRAKFANATRVRMGKVKVDAHAMGVWFES